MLRWHAPSNRPAASWCDPKSAVCTTATNGKPLIPFGCTGHDVAGRGGLPANSLHRISRRNSTARVWRCPIRVVERRFLGELIELENRLARGYGDGQAQKGAQFSCA
jgi:hypothetical protein